MPRKELPPLRSLAGEIFLLLPLYVLLLLLLSGYSIVAAGTWGLVSTLLVIMVRELKLPSVTLALPLAAYSLIPLTPMAVNKSGTLVSAATAAVFLVFALATGKSRAVPDMARQVATSVTSGLSETARKSLQLIAVMACAGIVVGVLGLTGLSGRFSAVLLQVSGDNLFLAFILAMMISIILGMGMPTTAAYAIAASVVAPALQQMGVAPLAAHMFVFYCAVISAITPPVAIASFAASALSGGQPWRTSVRAMRFGMAAFLLPYMFYTSPQILLLGDAIGTLVVFVTALIAVYLLASASEGILFGRMTPAERAAALLAGVLLLWSSPTSDIVGLVAGGALILWCRRRGGDRHVLANDR